MQPQPYEKSTDFQTEEQNLVAGRSTLRNAALDAELAALEVTAQEILDNIRVLQRDDTKLRDAIVELHTLSSEVLALITGGAYRVRGPWVTSTAYLLGDIVSSSAVPYLCVTAHTSGVFATDLAAGRWVAMIAQSAMGLLFSATATISAVNVQLAIEELDGELRPGVAVLLNQQFGGL